MSEYGSPSNVLRLLAHGPVGDGSPFESTEGHRRVAEWERQIETLDQKEMELHQTHLKIVREQTATFLRDLGTLRQEVTSLRLRQDAMSAELAAGLDVKHRELWSFVEKETRERDAAHEKLNSRLLSFELEFPGHKTALNELKMIFRDFPSVREDLERKCGDFDRRLASHKKATEDLIVLHADSLSKVQDAMGQYDFHHGSLDERLDNLARDVEIMVATRMQSTEASMNQLRAMIGGDKKVSERDLQAHHASISERLKGLEQALGESFSSIREQGDHHASIADRMGYLEKAFGDSAEKHQRELQTAQKKLEQLHGKLSEGQSLMAHHASTQERLGYVEKLIGDSADKHVKELAAAHAKIQEAHGKLGDLHKDRAIKEQQHATLEQRLDYLEGVLGNSADQHAAELAALRAAHDKQVAALSKHAQDVSGLANDKKALAQHHATLQERLEYVERLLGDSADRHSKELDCLRSAHDKHLASYAKFTREFEALKVAHAHHATVGERVGYLEKLMGDSADKHSQELAAARVKLEQMHGRLSACEKGGGVIEELRKSHSSLVKEKNDLFAHHSGVQERLKYLEGLIGDSADRHAAELANLKAAHEKHAAATSRHGKDVEALRAAQAHHASMAERVDYLERLLGDSADRHADALAAAHAKLEQLHGRLAACEKHGPSISELQKSHAALTADRAEQEAHHASVMERLGFLEQVLGDSADRHARELRSLQDAHAKHANDVQGLKSAHSRHASVEERLNYIEKALGDSADQHGSELAAAHARLEQLHGRLAVCEGHGTSVAELKKAHSGLVSEKTALATQHASLGQRVNYLEGLVGDSADKHAKLLEAAHAKLEQMHGRVSACEKNGQLLGDLKKAHGDLASSRAALEAHHSSLQERMGYVEKMLGDSADKHGRDIQDLRAAHDKHLTALSKQAKEVEGLKAASTHHASVAERLNYLEQTLGDSADKHVAELAALKQRQEQLHGKLADERAERDRHQASVKDLIAKEKDQRDSHQASVAERVGYLESIVGDNADKHAKELAEAKTVAARLASDVKARDSLHGSIADRLARVEKGQGDVSARFAQEFQNMQAKVDIVYTRISAVKCALGGDTPQSSTRPVLSSAAVGERLKLGGALGSSYP